MKLVIGVFKRLNGIELNFIDYLLTLIKANSGKGKTTVLKSIGWCLYGNLSSKNVDCPITGKKACVTIYMDDFIIERSRHRAISTEVRRGNSILKGDAAEAFIEETFGTYKVWEASSYLSQKCENSFLHESSDKKRIEFLHQLAYNKVSPTKELETCTSIVNNYKQKVSNLRYQIDTLNQMYEREKLKGDISHHCDNDTMLSMTKNRDTLYNEIINLQKLENKNKENIMKSDILNKDLININTKIQSLKNLIHVIPITDNIDNLIKLKKIELYILEKRTLLETLVKHDINFDDNYLYQIKDKERRYLEANKIFNQLGIEHNRNNLNTFISETDIKIKLQNVQHKVKEKMKLNEILSQHKDNNFTEKDYIATLKIESTLDQNRKICDRLGVQYNQESIKLEKNKIQQNLDYQEIINKIEKKKSIIKELETFPVLEQSTFNFTHQDLHNVANNEKIYNTNLNLCQRYGIEYNKENVIYFNTSTNYIKNFYRRSRYPHCTPHEYEAEKEKLSRLKEGLKCLECPSCKASLVVQRSQLIKSEFSMSTQAQVNESMIKVENMREYVNLSKNIPNDFVPKDIKFTVPVHDNDLDILSTLKYVERGQYTSKFIADEIEKNRTYDKFINRKRELDLKLNKLSNIDINTVLACNKLTLQEKKQLNLKLEELNKIEFLDLPLYNSLVIKSILDAKKAIIHYSDIPDHLENEISDINLEAKYNIARTIVYEDKPEHTSQYVASIIEDNKKYEEVVKKLNSAIKDMNNQQPPNMTLQELEILKNKIIENNQNNYRLEEEIKNQIRLTNEINSIIIDHEISNTIVTKIATYTSIFDQINKSIISNGILNLKNQYDALNNELNSYNNEIEIYGIIIKKAIIDGEKQSLSNVIVNINNTLNSILAKMFIEDRMIFNFSLVKTLKSGKEKDGIGIEILYKGHKYNGIVDLSEGERNRVDIALTLAFSKIRGSKLLLLDEPCRSLHDDLKETCMEVISKNSGCTKICIAHGEVDTVFDKVIYFNN